MVSRTLDLFCRFPFFQVCCSPLLLLCLIRGKLWERRLRQGGGEQPDELSDTDCGDDTFDDEWGLRRGVRRFWMASVRIDVILALSLKLSSSGAPRYSTSSPDTSSNSTSSRRSIRSKSDAILVSSSRTTCAGARLAVLSFFSSNTSACSHMRKIAVVEATASSVRLLYSSICASPSVVWRSLTRFTMRRRKGTRLDPDSATLRSSRRSFLIEFLIRSTPRRSCPYRLVRYSTATVSSSLIMIGIWLSEAKRWISEGSRSLVEGSSRYETVWSINEADMCPCS